MALAIAVPAQAIVYGEFDGNRHPNVGALIADFGDPIGQLDEDDNCSGALIAENVFLSAAHCIAALDALGIPRDEVFVSFDPVISETRRSCRGHRSPIPSLAGARTPNDVAVIVLDDPAAGISPAQLPPEGPARRAEGRSRAGRADLHGGRLRSGSGRAQGRAGTCYGDSGGPHFLGGVESNMILSITVTGDAVCKATDKTYRMDIDSARDFLDDFVDLA